MCNPVIVHFIETLTNNNQFEGLPTEEKLFKRAVAVDAIYGSRHLKYVSAISLAASAIKYSLTRSKTIIDIDNHIVSSGGYTKFTNWLESLTVEQQPLPKGFLCLSFDNEQKGQKNYLDRGYNTVVFHTVTSFAAFLHDQSDNIQLSTNPWLHAELTEEQCEELFDLTPDMKNELHNKLTKYLATILEELLTEKNQEKNRIDESVKYQEGRTGYIKNV